MLTGDATPACNCYRFATSRAPFGVVKAVDGRLVAHGEPFAIGVHGELDARVADGVLPISTAHPRDVRCGGRPHGRAPAEGRRQTRLQHGVEVDSGPAD